MINNIFKNSGAEFPLKVGKKEEVQLYASRLVNGECQLLISYCGELYLTKGDSTYIEISGSGIDQSLDNLKVELSKLDAKIDLSFEALTTALEDIENGNLEKFELINADIKNNTKKIDELDDKFVESINKVNTDLSASIQDVNKKLTASIDEIKEILTAGKQSIVVAINKRDGSVKADITHSFDELAVLIGRIDSIPSTPIEPGIPTDPEPPVEPEPPTDQEPEVEIDPEFGVDHDINGVMPEVPPVN